MAELSRPNVVGLGQIGDIMSVTPRTPQQSGLLAVQGAMQGIGASIKATNVDAAVGAQNVQFGQALFNQGQELMKPLIQLAQAREVIQSQDIAVQAALDMRSQVQALKSGGTDHMTWLAEGTKAIDKLSVEAVKKARALSPAAEEYVTRELQQERIRLSGDLQGAAFKTEVDRQQTTLERLDTHARQTFFNLGSVEERAELSGRLAAAYQTAVHTGVMKAEEAQRKLNDYQLHLETNIPTYLVDEIGLPGAIEYVRQSQILGPDQKAQAEQKVIGLVNSRRNMNEASEKAAEKAIKLEQDFLGQKMLKTVLDPNTPIADLNTIAAQSVDLVDPKKRGLRDEQSQLIQTTVRKVIEDRTKPVERQEDQNVVNARLALIIADGQNVDLVQHMTEILDDPRIGKSAGMLFNELQKVKDKNHFRNSKTFQGLTKQLTEVQPGQMLFDPKSSGSSIASEIQAGILQLDLAIGSAANRDGYLSDQEILRIGQPLVSTLREQLRSKKTPNIGMSFDDLTSLGGGSSAPFPSKSQERLTGMQPSAAQKALEFERLATKEGIPVRITSGKRSGDEQERLYAQGRTAPGKIVTNAKRGESKHEHGNAFDVVPLNKAGQPDWESPHWDRLGAIGKSIGLKWGGDFTTIKDRPHFEYEG